MTKRALACALLAVTLAAPAEAAPLLVPPVEAGIARVFDPPSGPYGAGHRGIDYAVPAGSPVRAAGDGVVTFAGRVANVVALTIDHGDGLETTYSSLDLLYVEGGDRVAEGTWLATTADSHPGGPPGLHFAVKLHDQYVDPQSYLGPAYTDVALSLAPVVADDEVEPVRTALATSNFEKCRPLLPLPDRPPAPNDHIAVTISGLASSSGAVAPRGVADYGTRLGYKTSYEFSYAGSNSASLHEPYGAEDTYDDIAGSAHGLRMLLERIARRHPGATVDLIAHSQGGIVARAFLEAADAYDPNLPRIGHVVTLSSPHGGAPASGELDELDDTLTGRTLLGLVEEFVGDALPDRDAPSVGQLAPGSPLMNWLVSEDVVNGARVLSLGIPHDLVVPADRALWQGERGAVVSPSGLNGHGAILESPHATSLAHAFLRDAPPPCRGFWDAWGPRIGRLVSAAEGGLDWAFRALDFLVTPGAALSRLLN